MPVHLWPRKLAPCAVCPAATRSHAQRLVRRRREEAAAVPARVHDGAPVATECRRGPQRRQRRCRGAWRLGAVTIRIMRRAPQVQRAGEAVCKKRVAAGRQHTREIA